MTDRLDPDAAKEVLRRAAELAAEDPVSTEGYDRAALAEAAAEVGIDRRAVERALAEHDVGLLAAASPSPGLLGPSRAVAARTVSLTPTAAHDLVEAWLRRQMLELSERHGRLELWRPRADLAAKVRRKVDAKITKKVRLGNVDAVTVSVADAGSGASVVRLEAELDDMRRGLTTGVVAVPTAVTPVLGGAAGLLTGEILFFAGSVPLALALGGLGVVGGRRTLAHERDEAERVLTLFLDELDGG